MPEKRKTGQPASPDHRDHLNLNLAILIAVVVAVVVIIIIVISIITAKVCV